MGVSDIDSLKAADMGGKSVETAVTDAIATIGENMTLRRMDSVEGDAVAAYVHNAANPTMGKIGVLVAYKGDNDAFARQVAMHVAAADPRPEALNEDELDPAVVEKEKQIQMDIARESGKPEAVIEKNDRRSDEEIPGRDHAAQPVVCGQPRPDCRRGCQGSWDRNHRLYSSRRWRRR